jgi:hypothetical protein
VLLGNGDGTFNSARYYVAGSDPESIVAADVNGDGRPDLVSANTQTAELAVLLNLGKVCGFEAP